MTEERYPVPSDFLPIRVDYQQNGCGRVRAGGYSIIYSRIKWQLGKVRLKGGGYLAGRIAHFIGNRENLITEIPRLSLHRRTAPTALCHGTYEAGVIVIAQGRKQVQLGRTTFIYDPSRFLLTSIDLPIVSRVVKATEESPCLALGLKFDMAVVRELLSRDEFHALDDSAGNPAMSGG